MTHWVTFKIGPSLFGCEIEILNNVRIVQWYSSPLSASHTFIIFSFSLPPLWYFCPLSKFIKLSFPHCTFVSMIVKIQISSMGFGLNDDLVFISLWSASIHQHCHDTLTPNSRMQSHKEPEHHMDVQHCQQYKTKILQKAQHWQTCNVTHLIDNTRNVLFK